MLYLKLKSIAHREGDAVACLGHNSDVAVRMEMQLDDIGSMATVVQQRRSCDFSFMGFEF
ncbi:hypothetical protein KY285_005947 [Solanum tuberosum]|nr:hypothetical protein KY289_006435 [Solanum tuberosum]KAH0752799.1 hypothetical protein KY285_005947 [Solanum tuberosum]